MIQPVLRPLETNMCRFQEKVHERSSSVPSRGYRCSELRNLIHVESFWDKLWQSIRFTHVENVDGLVLWCSLMFPRPQSWTFTILTSPGDPDSDKDQAPRSRDSSGFRFVKQQEKEEICRDSHGSHISKKTTVWHSMTYFSIFSGWLKIRVSFWVLNLNTLTRQEAAQRMVSLRDQKRPRLESCEGRAVAPPKKCQKHLTRKWREVKLPMLLVWQLEKFPCLGCQKDFETLPESYVLQQVIPCNQYHTKVPFHSNHVECRLFLAVCRTFFGSRSTYPLFTFACRASMKGSSMYRDDDDEAFALIYNLTGSDMV